MRTTTGILAVLLTAPALWAQDQEPTLGRLIFSAPGDTITGGYVTVTGKVGEVMGDRSFFVGTRVGATVGHWFSFGVVFHGMTNRIRNPWYEGLRAETGAPAVDGLAFGAGYGGLFVEPTVFRRSMVHLSFPLAFGAGGMGYSYPRQNGQEGGRVRTDAATFFFVEPGVELELNVVRNVRLGVGGSYLFTTETRLPSTGPKVLEQPFVQCSLKFGVF